MVSSWKSFNSLIPNLSPNSPYRFVYRKSAERFLLIGQNRLRFPLSDQSICLMNYSWERALMNQFTHGWCREERSVISRGFPTMHYPVQYNLYRWYSCISDQHLLCLLFLQTNVIQIILQWIVFHEAMNASKNILSAVYIVLCIYDI